MRDRRDWRGAQGDDWPPSDSDWTLRKLFVRFVAALLLLSLVVTLGVAWNRALGWVAIVAVFAIAVSVAKAVRRGGPTDSRPNTDYREPPRLG